MRGSRKCLDSIEFILSRIITTLITLALVWFSQLDVHGRLAFNSYPYPIWIVTVIEGDDSLPKITFSAAKAFLKSKREQFLVFMHLSSVLIIGEPFADGLSHLRLHVEKNGGHYMHIIQESRN